MLKCGSCGIELHGRDVDFDALRASCRRCGWQLGRKGAYRQPVARAADASDVDMPEDRVSPSVSQSASKPALLPWLPPYITVSESPGRLDVVVRESRLWRFVLAEILMVIMIWLQMELRGMTLWFAVPWFLIVTWIVGIMSANTRTLRIVRGELTVRHAPFPWFGKRVAVDDLEQLWVDEQSHRGDITYRLRARARGRDMTLVAFIPDAPGALHLERRIETMLDIADLPVAGEIGR
jgi:hypothetical protein